MDVIDEYGCDALRYFLTTSSAPGMDLRYDEEKVKSTWNFINKLWNASRFVLMNIEDLTSDNYTLNNLAISDKWILTKLNNLIKVVRKHMDKYEFNVVGSELYTFIWNDFCDWYIELAKSNMNNTTKSVLFKVLTDILKMLHPFMPFVTEEIYSMLPIKETESIMISEYPKYASKYVFNSDKEEMDKILEDIVAIRNLKANNNIGKQAMVSYKVSDNYQNIYVSQLKLDRHDIYNNSNGTLKPITYKSKFIEIIYYVKKQDDNNTKVLEEIKKLEASIERREKLLSNDNYVNKAPSHIVELDRKKLQEEKDRLAILTK